MIAPAIVATVFAALIWLSVPRAWRGPYRGEHDGANRDQLVDIRRRALAAALGITSMAIAALIDVIWGHHATLAKLGIVLFGAGLLGFAGCAVAIHLFHRPRWLIPPDLRDAPHRRRRA